jgi:hypothetical protein
MKPLFEVPKYGNEFFATMRKAKMQAYLDGLPVEFVFNGVLMIVAANSDEAGLFRSYLKRRTYGQYIKEIFKWI